MKRYCRYSALAVLLILAVGCGKKTAQLQSKAVPPDKTLFANANEYLDKSQFIKARLSYQTLINAYPDSDFTPKAFFEIGNTYYKEGGTEALLQAESQFKDFQLFYPTSDLAAEAQFKVASIHMRMMLEPERDSSHTKKAEDEFKRFVAKYPDHELTPVAKEFLKEIMENQAMSDYKVGDYYYSKNVPKAAVGRYKRVVDQYPDFSRADEALFKLAQSLEKLNRPDEAALYYSRLSAEYPESTKLNLAHQRLDELKKPIPPVDVAKAEIHRKINAEEGFSVTRPLKDFAAAMGLTGQGDPYARAVRKVEETRQAQILAASNKTQTTDPTRKAEGADEKDIVISTTLSKTATTPATADTTVKEPAKQPAKNTKDSKDVKKDKKPPDKEKKPGS